MRVETGQALLTAIGGDGCADRPTLSSLVHRVVGERSAPTTQRPLRASATFGQRHLHVADGQVRPGQDHRSSPGPALLGAHGGAGVSSLLRAGLAATGARDAGRSWPSQGPVLVVARSSVSGLQAASNCARSHSADALGPASTVLGLVLVADAPGRLPRQAARLADLVTGGYARTWQIPWLDEWRLAAVDAPLPPHPEVRRLVADVAAALDRTARRVPQLPLGDSA